MAQASGTHQKALAVLLAWTVAACAAAPGAATGVAAPDAAAADAAPSQDAAAAADQGAPAQDAVAAADSSADASVADTPSANLLAPGPIEGELFDGIELSGAYTLTGAVVVPAGAVVLVHAGSTFTSPFHGITVEGTLVLNGTKAKPVILLGPASGPAWLGVKVSGKLLASHFEVAYATTNVESTATGTLELDHGFLHHAVKFNLLSRGKSELSRLLIEKARAAAKDTFNLGVLGGSTTLEDSILRDTPNECILAEGKCTLVARYNLLNSGHCGIHFNGTAQADVSHNEFKGNLYGLMLFGLQAGSITGNNFFDSAKLEILSDSNTQPKPVVATGNYWGDKKKFYLDGAKIDSSNALAQPATDVGPREEK